MAVSYPSIKKPLRDGHQTMRLLAYVWKPRYLPYERIP
jgi:hypothetical protein